MPSSPFQNRSNILHWFLENSHRLINWLLTLSFEDGPKVFPAVESHFPVVMPCGPGLPNTNLWMLRCWTDVIETIIFRPTGMHVWISQPWASRYKQHFFSISATKTELYVSDVANNWGHWWPGQMQCDFSPGNRLLSARCALGAWKKKHFFFYFSLRLQAPGLSREIKLPSGRCHVHLGSLDDRSNLSIYLVIFLLYIKTCRC